MTVTLNASSTPVAVEALMRNVTFTINSHSPSTLTRRVTFVVTDGDGGTSNIVFYAITVVPVNDIPVLSSISGDVVYSEGTAPRIVASTAGVADVDSANFDSGNLTVSIIARFRRCTSSTCGASGWGRGS